MYQILIKVPVGEGMPNPNEVFQQACEINPKVGEIHVSNSEFTSFGYNSETDDSGSFSSLPENVEVVAVEIT